MVSLVSGCSQGQHNWVSYLQHRLQDGSNDNEEDDGEEERSVDDLKLNKPGLDSEDQQRDAFGHPPAETEHKQCRRLMLQPDADRITHTRVRSGRVFRPVHGVVIHEGSVTLKIELAERENSQSNEGDGENKAQQGVRRTTAFCNTVDKNRQANKHMDSPAYHFNKGYILRHLCIQKKMSPSLMSSDGCSGLTW